MICPAFIPATFDPSNRLKFLGLHAMAVVSVIRRHIVKGFQLKSIERTSNGSRVDIIFENSGKTRLVEVKSAKYIREVHRLQAALYWRPNIDEIVVSNRETDQVLTTSFLMETADRAEATLRLLEFDPQTAATTYKPNPDCCYICDNTGCPFLKLAKAYPPGGSAN